MPAKLKDTKKTTILVSFSSTYISMIVKEFFLVHKALAMPMGKCRRRSKNCSTGWAVGVSPEGWHIEKYTYRWIGRIPRSSRYSKHDLLAVARLLFVLNCRCGELLGIAGLGLGGFRKFRIRSEPQSYGLFVIRLSDCLAIMTMAIIIVIRPIMILFDFLRFSKNYFLLAEEKSSDLYCWPRVLFTAFHSFCGQY